MSRRYLRATLVSAGLTSLGFLSVTLLAPHPLLMWNASASAPIGLYRIGDAAPVLGDLVAIAPPPAAAHFLAGRHYLPVGVPLMKHVAALPGQTVCRYGSVVTIDRRPVAVAKARDRADRPLPVWYGCRTVRDGELFLLNPAPDSLDGRYFGVLRTSGLIGTAHPILTRDASGQPLRWRGFCARDVFPQAIKMESRP